MLETIASNKEKCKEKSVYDLKEFNGNQEVFAGVCKMEKNPNAFVLGSIIVFRFPTDTKDELFTTPRSVWAGEMNSTWDAQL